MTSREQEPSAEDMNIRRELANQELTKIFKTTLGFDNIGQPDPEGRIITPFSIVTNLRNGNTDLSVTREQALTHLLESNKIPFTMAVRTSVLWGASYGQQTFGDTLTRIIAGYNLPDKERITAENILLEFTRSVVRVLGPESATGFQALQHLQGLKELEGILSGKTTNTLTKEERADLETTRVILEYLVSEHTPELATGTWSALWQIKGVLDGKSYTVTPCNRTALEIQEIESTGRSLIYIPPELAEAGRIQEDEKEKDIKEKRPRLKKARVAETEKPFVDQIVQSGWLDIDASVAAPFTNTTEEELAKIFTSQNRVSATVMAYEIASSFSEWTTGMPFDKRQTRTRLLHTRRNGQALTISTNRYGEFELFMYAADKRDKNLGGRSVGVKQTS